MQYCVQDVVLLLLLLKKLNMITSMMAMARTMGLPLQMLLNHGQSIHMLHQVCNLAITKSWVIPHMPQDYNAKSANPNTSSKHSPKGYTGAIVIKPKKGYYNFPVITFHFSSLSLPLSSSLSLDLKTLLSSLDG